MGYSRDMDDRGAFWFKDFETQADGIFVKVSYRLRL